MRNNLQCGRSDRTSHRTRAARAGYAESCAASQHLLRCTHHLLGVGLTRVVDGGEYARLLCDGLPNLQAGGTEAIVLTCHVVPMLLELDTVTALGLAMTELVANSYEHAFPDGVGHIAVSGGPAARLGWCELIISDNGVGYKTLGESKRHGVGLVYRLMEQLSGSVEVHVGPGTSMGAGIPAIAGE